jgi:hypothetical protein
VPDERRFLMAGREADFRRLMPIAFPGVGYDAARRRFTAPDGGWSLELGEAESLVIAALRLPMIAATFHFTMADAEPVIATFLRHFQRGGG